MEVNFPLEQHSFHILDVSKPEPVIPPCSKYPLKEYEIWGGAFTDQGMEGHWATPTLLGTEKGRNFQDACMRLALRQEYEARLRYDQQNVYYDTKRWDYNPATNSIWAIQLHESKDEAWNAFAKMAGMETYTIYYKNCYNK